MYALCVHLNVFFDRLHSTLILLLLNKFTIHIFVYVMQASKSSQMAPGSRRTKASRNSQGGRPSSISTRSMPESSANTHVPQERNQARVEEELIPPSAFESREVNTTMLLRSSCPISDANEGTCSMSPMDQASDIAGQEVPILDEGRKFQHISIPFFMLKTCF